MFFLGLTIGLILGVAFHINRTKAQYAAFIAARAQLRIEQRRIENMKARQQRLKTMLEVSRSGGRLNFGESAPLPAIADAGQRPLSWQRQAQSQTLAGPVMRARPRVF